MSTLFTVGVEVQASAAQQAIMRLERAFDEFARRTQSASNATQQFDQKLDGATKEVGKFADEMEAANRRQEEFESGANRLLKVLGAGALLASIKQYTGSIIQLGQSTQSAIAANSTLAKDADGLNSAFRELTKELNYSTNSLELNQAAYDVLSAGVSETADVVNVMKAGVAGAKGGFSDLATMTDAVTTIMNAYGKSSEEAQKIVDMMIATQNDGKIVAAQYGQQIGVVAAGAATAGVKLEELNAAISVATVAGVQVSSTFSGLRQAISSIVSPSEQAKKIAKELGIEFSQAGLQQKGLVGVLKDVAEATQGNAEQITKLFGSVEAKAVIDPILNNLQKYEQFLSNQTQTAGAATEAQQKLAGGLQASQAAFANVRKEVEIDIFRTIEPVVTALTNTTTSLAKAFVSLPEPIQKVAIGAGLLTTALAATTAAMIAFQAMGITTTVAMGALSAAMKLFLSPIGLVVIAVGGLYLAFQQMMQASEKLREVMSTAMERMGDSVGKIFDSLGRAVNALTGQYAKHEKESKGIFERMGDWFADFVNNTIRGYEIMGDAAEQWAYRRERAAGVGTVEGISLTELERSGNTVKIGNAMNQFTSEIAKAEAELATLEATMASTLESDQGRRSSGFDYSFRSPVDSLQKDIEQRKKDIKAMWQGYDRLNQAMRNIQNRGKSTEPDAGNPANPNPDPNNPNLTTPTSLNQQLNNETAIADRREQEFREQQQRERAAFDDRQRFEELSFDQRADYELRLFDLQTRHQELLRQERLDTESEIARAVIESQRKIEDYQRQIERRRLERQFRQQQQLLQIQNLQQQQAFGVPQANSAVSFGTGLTTQTGAMGVSQIKQGISAASKFNGIVNMCAAAVKAFTDSIGINTKAMNLTAESAKKVGQVMTDFSQIQPGDIIGWSGGPRHGDEHVGVYLGGNQVFHQSRSRGLKVGAYNDFNYFKKQRGAYFVRPSGSSSAASSGASSGTTSTPSSGVGAVSDLQIQGQINQLRFDELTTAQEMLLEQQELLKLYEDQADIVPRMVRENVKGLQEQTKQMEIESKLLRLRGEEKRQYLAQLQYEEMYLDEKVELEKLIANTTNDTERAALQKAYNQLLKQEGEIRAAIAAGQFAEDQLRADRARFDWRKTQESMMDSETEATRQLERQLGLLKQSTEQRQQYLAMIKTEEAVQKQILELRREMDGENNAEINKAIDEIRASAPELYRFYLEQYRAQTALNKEIDYYNEQLRLSQAIADGLGDSFANAFGEFVMGTKSAQEAFASMMSSIANVFMQEFQRMVAQRAAAGLLGFISNIFLGGNSSAPQASVSGIQPFDFGGGASTTGFSVGNVIGVDQATAFADGGIVTKPMLGLVGEAGKEAIIPLDRLEGLGNNVTINVSVANDGSTTTDQQNANQLGRELETAVVAVLQKQKRPGGLLASVR